MLYMNHHQKGYNQLNRINDRPYLRECYHLINHIVMHPWEVNYKFRLIYLSLHCRYPIYQEKVFY